MAKIEVKNTERLLKRLNSIKSPNIPKIVKEATLLVHGQAVELASVKNGLLRESIHMEVKEYENIVVGKIFTNNLYAPYVEFGTGIKGNGQYPYKVKGLQLTYRDTPWRYTPDGGETFYYTKGQAPQPFMYPALNMHEKHIKKLLKARTKEEIDRICKGG